MMRHQTQRRDCSHKAGGDEDLCRRCREGDSENDDEEEEDDNKKLTSVTLELSM